MLSPALFGRSPWLVLPQSFELLVADPLDACSVLRNSASPAAAVAVLTVRGNCSFGVKALNVQARISVVTSR